MSIFLDSSPYSSYSVKVHPVVIWSILDHFLRRSEGQDKVVGTLLGINFDGMIEVRNCFPLPVFPADNGQIEVDMDFHKNVAELHHKANNKELMIGWYSTSSLPTAQSVLIHQFYAREMAGSGQAPIHLTVDTDLAGKRLNIAAFISQTISSLTSPDKPLAVNFLPIPLDYSSSESERIGLDALMRIRNAPQQEGDKSAASPILSDLAALQVSLNKLISLMDTVTEYVDSVLEGKREADPKIGRYLWNTVASLPKVDTASFEKMFSNSLQDMLMVVYLSNLTRGQLLISEKLQALGPEK